MNFLEFVYISWTTFLLIYGIFSNVYYMGKGGQKNEYDVNTLFTAAIASGVLAVMGIVVLLGWCL